MNQLQIDISADSRRARQEFDTLDRAIRTTDRSIIAATGSLGNLEAAYRGLSRSAEDGQSAIALEERRQEALRQSATAAREAQAAISGVSAGNGTPGSLSSSVANILSQVNTTLDTWVETEFRKTEKVVKGRVSSSTHPANTLPDDLSIQGYDTPRVRSYNTTSDGIGREGVDIDAQLAAMQYQRRVEQLGLMQELHERQLALDGEYDQLALEQLQARYEQEMTILEGEGAAQVQLTTQYELQKERIRKEADKRETQRQMQVVMGVSRMFGNMAKIAQTFGKEGFEAWKRLSQAQAILDGIQAVQSAYAWGMKYGGPLLATVNAGIAAGVAAANVASIETQSYANGGFVHARVSNGEYFVDPITASRHRPLLELLRSGPIHGPGTSRSDSIDALVPEGGFIIPATAFNRPGYAGGGWVGISQGIGSSSGTTSDDRLIELLEGIRGQLRALNVNVVRQQPTITVENRSRDIETVIKAQDYTRKRMMERGYDGHGANLAL
jgi:hypothetical protein